VITCPPHGFVTVGVKGAAISVTPFVENLALSGITD
jgi:hypothetical protein